MARLPRYGLPGQPQHVIQRGNNRSALFRADADYRTFRGYLIEACQRHECNVHAYVFMPNHIHLLITPFWDGAIGKVMQSVGRRYVQYFNYTYHRTGTLWEGRYRATPIDSENYLLTCYRYIELNPVRAGIEHNPAGYPWSSYGRNALGKPDQLVTPHALYLSLGKETTDLQNAYRSLFREIINETTIATIRDATNKGWALGSDRFRQKIEDLLKRRARPLRRGGNRRTRQLAEDSV